MFHKPSKNKKFQQKLFKIFSILCKIVSNIINKNELSNNKKTHGSIIIPISPKESQLLDKISPIVRQIYDDDIQEQLDTMKINTSGSSVSSNKKQVKFEQDIQDNTLVTPTSVLKKEKKNNNNNNGKQHRLSDKINLKLRHSSSGSNIKYNKNILRKTTNDELSISLTPLPMRKQSRSVNTLSKSSFPLAST